MPSLSSCDIFLSFGRFEPNEEETEGGGGLFPGDLGKIAGAGAGSKAALFRPDSAFAAAMFK
jgi:hypothetical protein